MTPTKRTLLTTLAALTTTSLLFAALPATAGMPQSDSERAAYQTAYRAAYNTKLSAKERLTAVDAYLEKYPKSRFAQRLRGTRNKLAFELVVHGRKKLTASGLLEDAIFKAFSTHTEWFGQPKADSITLRHKNGLSVKGAAPAYIGLGSTRSALVWTIQHTIFGSATCSVWNQSCQVKTFNGFSRMLFKGDLYTKTATLNPQVLDRVLKGMWTSPNKKILGVKLGTIYQANRAVVAEHLRAWKVMAPDRKKHIATYKAIYKKHNGAKEKWNSALMRAYREEAKSMGMAQRAKMSQNHSYYSHMLVSFWMRRFADGSDRVLIKHAKKWTKAYDPALYREVFGKR